MKRIFNAYLESDEEKLFNDLTDLASKIASAYANHSIIMAVGALVFNMFLFGHSYPMMLKDKAHLSRLISGGIEYSLDSVPRNLPFLGAVIPPLARQCSKEQRVRRKFTDTACSLYSLAKLTNCTGGRELFHGESDVKK